MGSTSKRRAADGLCLILLFIFGNIYLTLGGPLGITLGLIASIAFYIGILIVIPLMIRNFKVSKIIRQGRCSKCGGELVRIAGEWKCNTCRKQYKAKKTKKLKEVCYTCQKTLDVDNKVLCMLCGQNFCSECLNEHQKTCKFSFQ